jgi:hypothetical protein
LLTTKLKFRVVKKSNLIKLKYVRSKTTRHCTKFIKNTNQGRIIVYVNLQGT